ncbi:MAG: MaoC/PaaZ C-terminal domain-containing protein [Candidatus Sifarchaeia archaeon]
MTDETIRLNRDFLGKEYHSEPQIINPDSIRKYALATNERNPRYLSSESDTELVPPPIFPVVFLPGILSQLVNDAEEMNFNILRVVHAEHHMSWKSALHVGDKIHTTAKIINMEQRGANEILDLLIQCKRDDEAVVEMTYRLLVRSMKKTDEKKQVAETREPEKRVVLVRHQSTVTVDQGVRYAQASGDHNPIHISEEAAKSVGLPSTILHGLCTMALASQGIVDGFLDGDPMRLKSMSVRFSRPVLLDQTLTTEVYDAGESKEGMKIVHFETRDEKGVPVLVLGRAEFIE